MNNQNLCTHLNTIETVNTGGEYCEECVKSGSGWVHLRTCQTCGITLCCDDSPQKHMTKHYKQSNHPVIASAEPGERWLWCYVDEQVIEY
jgi:hypothetical protein